jgi:hypothetical protein
VSAYEVELPESAATKEKCDDMIVGRSSGGEITLGAGACLVLIGILRSMEAGERGKIICCQVVNQLVCK